MIRALLFILLALGCATPDAPIIVEPEPPAPPPPIDVAALAAMDEPERTAALRVYLSEARAAGAIPGPVTATAALPDGYWDDAVPIRWQDLNFPLESGEVRDITFQAQPQHFTWMTWVPSKPIPVEPGDALADGRTLVSLHWEGCTRVQGALWNDPFLSDPSDPDSWDRKRSEFSNEVLVGECLDPPPDPVPEPPGVLTLACGVSLLALIRWRYVRG